MDGSRQAGPVSGREQPLRPAEDSFRAVVEQSIAGIYVIQDGRVAYANPKFCEIFGYSREEVARGIGVEQLTDPADVRDRTEMLTLAEQQEAILAVLEVRRDDLRRRLEQ